ncbi:hypothetical protein ACFIQF_09650 [Comamonas sp. J-3]
MLKHQTHGAVLERGVDLFANPALEHLKAAKDAGTSTQIAVVGLDAGRP